MAHHVKDYSEGKIYNLHAEGDPLIYIGHTILSLETRMRTHSRDSKLYPNRKVYKHLLQFGWEKIKIVLLEDYPCTCEDEMVAREQYWIDAFDNIKLGLNFARAKGQLKSVYFKEYHARPDIIARRASQSKEYRSKPEIQIRTIERRKEYSSRPEIILKHAEYLKEYKTRPGKALKMSNYHKNYESQPENKLRIAAYKKERESRPDVRARRNEMARAPYAAKKLEQLETLP